MRTGNGENVHNTGDSECLQEFRLYALIAAKEHGKDRRGIRARHNLRHVVKIVRTYACSPSHKLLCMGRRFILLNDDIARFSRKCRRNSIDTQKKARVDLSRVLIALRTTHFSICREQISDLSENILLRIIISRIDVELPDCGMLLAPLQDALDGNRVAYMPNAVRIRSYTRRVCNRSYNAYALPCSVRNILRWNFVRSGKSNDAQHEKKPHKGNPCSPIAFQNKEAGGKGND